MLINSIKVNYFLNLTRVALGALIGILTMPYINDTLGAEGLGKIEYVNSIITYFMLFSALGIPMYGIREVAKLKEKTFERSKLIIELGIILLITTLLSYIMIFGFLIHLDYFSNLISLIIIMSLMILFSNIGMEWFYQGMEDQVFITIRFIIVRVIFLGLLFVLIKSPEDYLYYGGILVVTNAGSNIFNFIYLRKYIQVNKMVIFNLDIKRHIKPIFTIFIATISVSIYINLDNVMLGSQAGSLYVGYYAMSNKLVRFSILFITTLGTVLLPRMSKLINEDRFLYDRYANKAISYILMIAIPFSVIFYLYAEDFTILMGGESFIPSINTMKILSPLIIVVGIAYFIGYLVLYSQGKEKIYTIATIISALFSIAINFLIIPFYKQDGVAVVAVFSELICIMIMGYLARKELRNVNFLNKNVLSYCVGGIVIMVVMPYCSDLLLSGFSLFIRVCLEVIISFLVFILTLILLKEEIILNLIYVFKNRMKINSE